MRVRDRSLIILISRGLNQVTAILLGVVLVRIVDQATFGTYRQGLLIYMTFVGFASLDIGASLYYFLPKLDRDQHGTLLAQSLGIVLALGACVCAVMFVCAPFVGRSFGNPSLVSVIRVLSLYPFAERLIILVPAFFICQDKPTWAGIYSLAATVLRIAGVITAFVLGGGVIAAAWMMVLVATIMAVIGVASMICRTGFAAVCVDSGLIREQFGYTWPLWMGVVVGTVNLQFGKLLISGYFDPATYAVYSVGAFDLPLIMLVSSSLNTAIMPNLVHEIAAGRKDTALYLWQEATRKASLVLFPSFVILFVCGADLMLLLYGHEYIDATWPFRIYLLAIPIRVTIYATIFRACGSTKYIAKGAVVMLLGNVVMSLVLTYGGKGGFLSFIGPAIGAICGNALGVVYLLLSLRAVVDVRLSTLMRWRQLGVWLVLSGVAALPVLALPLSTYPVALRLAISVVVYLMVFGGLTWKSGYLQSDERKMIAGAIARPFRLLGASTRSADQDWR
jgi:O-antigen/teichoic acid export membrane protein